MVKHKNVIYCESKNYTLESEVKMKTNICFTLNYIIILLRAVPFKRRRRGGMEEFAM